MGRRPVWTRPDAGMVTAELAVALPALAVVLVLALSALATVTDQVRCVDAARAVARAVARGDDPASATAVGRRLAPRGAHVEVTAGDELVEARVTGTSFPALSWLGARAAPRGEAVAAREDSG